MNKLLLFIFSFFGTVTLFAQGTETFTAIGGGTSSSYLDRNWTGDDGSTWTAEKSRIDQDINSGNDAVTLRDNSTAFIESGTISGGVGDLTITTQRKFSGGSGTVDVLINGNSVGTVPYSAAVETTTIPNINIAGDFTIRINNSAGDDRIAFDDLTWTAAAAGNPEVTFDGATSAITEGDAGTSVQQLAVTMTAEPTAAVTVNIASTDGSATIADNDYTAVITTLTFNTALVEGASYPITKFVDVTINGDTNIETDEDFTVTLSLDATNALFADEGDITTHTLTITNDDVLPIVGFTMASGDVTETDAGTTTTLTAVISMDKAPSSDVNIDVVSIDNSATENVDYVAVSSTLTFTAGGSYPMTQDVIVTVNGDDDFEGNETFNLLLDIQTASEAFATEAINDFEVTIIENDIAPAPQVTINEIMYDVPGDENDDEWIELYNSASTAVDVSCFAIADGDFVVTLPQGTSIPANGFLTIGSSTSTNGAGVTFTPDIDITSCSCNSLSQMILTNSGEFVALFDASDNFLDGVIFNTPSSGNSPANGGNSGIETYTAKAGCPSGTLDFVNDAGFAPNSYEDDSAAAGTVGENGHSLGRVPDGGSGFAYFEDSPDETSPGSTNFVVLPVELTVFEAKAHDFAVSLNWLTEQELNNDYFAIQHATDGRNFTTIDKVNGQGNSSTKVAYDFTHKTPINGVNYYRLQQFDFDGTMTLSQIITVKIEKGNVLAIYPNPVAHELNINTSISDTDDAIVEVINNAGAVVLRTIYATTVNTADLARGIYTLRIVQNGEVMTSRFVKE